MIYSEENLTPEWIVELVNSGRIQETRLDSSVSRLLRDKFLLGLFDNPYVDETKANTIVGSAPFVEAGKVAQMKSIVLLKNGEKESSPLLPLGPDERIFVQNVDSTAVARYATVVDSPADATVALLRIHAPYEPPREGGMLETCSIRVIWTSRELSWTRYCLSLNPYQRSLTFTLIVPAVIPEIAETAAALLGNFGASDEVILDAIFGQFSPSGRLPFEIPSSMDAVRAQLEDVPYDSENPIFSFGFGLSYPQMDTDSLSTN